MNESESAKIARNTRLMFVLTFVNLAIVVTNLLASMTFQDLANRVVRSTVSRPVFGAATVSNVRDREPAPVLPRPAPAMQATISSWVKLSPQERDAILMDLYIEQRVRAKTVGLLQVLDRKQRQERLQELSRADRDAIIRIAIDHVRKRAAVERTLALAESPDLDEWKQSLSVLDERLDKSLRGELGKILTEGETREIAPLILPPRYGVTNIR